MTLVTDADVYWCKERFLMRSYGPAAVADRGMIIERAPRREKCIDRVLDINYYCLEELSQENSYV